MVPDFLVVPSKLVACAKGIDETVCINPGYSAKGKAGGTYCRIKVYPFETGDMDDETILEHKVGSRSRVEIVKI